MTTTTPITSVCWCGSTEVVVPVEWVSEGRTLPCTDASCYEGCPMHEEDLFDVVPEPEPAPVPIHHKRMRVEMYDPREDSSPEYAPLHDVYANALIIANEPGRCACGCGTGVAARSKFAPGHDARLKGKLSRAAAADARVILVGPDGETHSTHPVDVARSFGSNWAAKVAAGAERIRERSNTPTSAERTLMRRVENGRDGYRLEQVGRWDKTNRVMAVWTRESDGETIYEYVSTAGELVEATGSDIEEAS